VLLDDSRSMQIPDQGGKSRGQYVQAHEFGANGALLKSLSDKFLVRVFRFSSSGRAPRLGQRDMRFDGAQTEARPGADERTRGARRTAGGRHRPRTRTAPTRPTLHRDALLGLKAERLPVFTVGVGSEKLPRDIQIDRVSTPRRVLKNAVAAARRDRPPDRLRRQNGHCGRRG
jgi:hypothetical protein